MAKFKVAGINNGVPTDRGIASGNGGVGGLTSLSGNQIQPTVKIGSASAASGSIIAQKGAHKFRVTDGTNTGTCTLVNLATPTVVNTMSIGIILANTTVLTCQSPLFQDNSPNVFALTVSGTPKVQRFSPFANYLQTPQSYSTKFNGLRKSPR